MLYLLLSLFINSADAHPFHHRPPVAKQYHYNCCVVVLTRPQVPPKLGFYHVWTGYEWIQLPRTYQDMVFVPGHYDPYGYWIPGYWKIL